MNGGVISSERFSEFFEALYGYEPFPWQSDLAARVADASPGDACWPQALSLPTSAGKTACIDIAVFALACQADRPAGQRTAPRRLFFVVDRRVIVDETFERARYLADRLLAARTGDGGILKDVADRLCSLGQGDADDAPLACFQLRGGMYRDDAWARSPLQPTVVVTTVDQFGSRLLFRGYGSSAGMRPVHAGLASNDCLILLDEAHCANPFRQTVSAVERYRRWNSQTGLTEITPFQLTLISATPPQDIAGEECLTAGKQDLEHLVLGSRIRTSKPAKLVVARPARGGDPMEGLARWAADAALELVGDERRAIGVLVNRVATAKLVYDHLRQEGRDVTLLVGRMRVIDRDDVVQRLRPLKTGAPREDVVRFVVATQTLEVGADLDFDGLVTECASIDALRQRFGRLNRGGRRIEARSSIIIRSDQVNPNNRATDDPVYGLALVETWQWLNSQANDGMVDFGYAAMDGILPAGDELRRLTQESPDAPVMLPAHVDAWVQTSPRPAPDPDLAIFLHGPNRGVPEVQVCWRADLRQSDLADRDRAVSIVSLCPPALSECIAVPIFILRRWLADGLNATDPEDSDVEGTRVPTVPDARGTRVRRQALRWRGLEGSRVISSEADILNHLRSGDTVVFPAELGGWDVFGHLPTDPEGQQIIDVGDRAHLQSRAKAVLRIHPGNVEPLPEPARSFLARMAARAAQSEETEVDGEELQQALQELGQFGLVGEWAWLATAADALAGDRRRKALHHPSGGIVLQGSDLVRNYGQSPSSLTSEDDSYSATVRVPLDSHLTGVASWADRLCRGAGLPAELASDLSLAARWHDVGKADPRFQALLHGGNLWAAGPPLLAKSDRLPTSRAEYNRARLLSRYPEGGRHELLSVRMIENSEILEGAIDRDLVLHLIGSHHGHCRPFAPVIHDEEPVEVSEFVLECQLAANSDTALERLDSGVPERFWRLVRRYGWWGLAWLEALLRLADHRCSEGEQKGQN